jgi:gamma-glutamylcyclotransferase (GGCT)/AIG2-like uncharacterized protein YtfP
MRVPGCNLFVYGTLMSASAGRLGAEQRARLDREARRLGPASTPCAELYDLGRCPGLVEGTNEASIVHGEALELMSPEETLRWLDAYEGIAGSDPEGEYARLKRTVHLDGGAAITAWVYVLRRKVPPHARIESGRWT